MQAKLPPVWPCKLLFFSSGFAYAVWGIGIAIIDKKFALNSQTLSVALFAVSGGSIVTMSPVGRLIARIGSSKVCEIGALLQAILMSAIMRVSSYESLLFVLFGFGVANAVFDTAMNAQTVAVEHQLNKSLLSTMHGLFSFGGICGSALGGLCVGYALAIEYAFNLSALLTLTSIFINRRYLIPDSTVSDSEHLKQTEKTTLRLIGALAFLALLAEGAMYDWTTIFMRDVAQANSGWIGSGYTSFSAGMMSGRLVGDRLRMIYGNTTVLKISAYLVVLGLVFALVKPAVLNSILGFALVGLGCANFIPILFKAAARTHPRAAGEGIAYVSRISYFGFLIEPVVIGMLASEYGLSFAFILIACCSILIAKLAKFVLSSGYEGGYSS
jgi:predicted MFS family arabinose efflux permease